MQIAGPLASRFGARPLVIVGGLGQAVLLPALAFSPDFWAMALSLTLFGGFLGAIEVGMNVHAVEVEKRAGRPLMSGFHGLFSVGGFIGASLMTFMLAAGPGALWGTLLASSLMVAVLILAAPRLIETEKVEQGPMLVAPRGVVVLLAGLGALTFLAEGAVLDWGALLLSEEGLLPASQAGAGYSFFAIAMTLGRLSGDSIVARLGDRRTMLWGGMLAIAGWVILLTAPVASFALAGFLLVGLGASNTVPVLFRQAGTQTAMPPGLAIASVTTFGYAGILLGPAGIGFLAEAIGLTNAFWVLAALLALVPLCAGTATTSAMTATKA